MSLRATNPKAIFTDRNDLRASDDVHRLNFAWLIRLRWVAIIGQTAVILTTRVISGVEFPFWILTPVLLAEIVSNLGLIAWAKTGRPRHQALVALVLFADLAFLTTLLFFTGGASNPFSLIYLIHVALAALVLPSIWTWITTAISALTFLGLHFVYSGADQLPWGPPPPISSLETQGHLVAFFVSAIVLAFFVNMIQRALTRRDQELIHIRDAQMRNEKLASLATLAAGAAHEFSTPLSTIALVAKELQLGLEKVDASVHFLDDTRLIRDQVERCRDILRQMSADAGESMGEIARPVAITELLEHTLDGCRDRRRVSIHITTDREASLTVPTTALGQALRGLVNNAIEATESAAPVELLAREEDESIVLEINDQGSGMSPQVLERIAEPFFTTKEAGQGMGLGVFLARTLVEKIGGELSITSQPAVGTSVVVRLPCQPAPELELSSPPTPHSLLAPP